jgi:hypothetical protein
MTTNAAIGYGSLFEYSLNGGSTWATLGEVKDITPPSETVDIIDATHMASPNRTRQYVEGLVDPGECSFTLNHQPGSATDLAIQSLRGAGAVDLRITFPNAVIWTFKGIRTGYEITAPTEGLMEATVTFKVTGSYVATPAAAPTNTTLPAISGVAQEGSVVTAFEGVWTAAPTFGFQWQELISAVWTNIAGATAKTLTVPGGSTIGRPLRVVVTGTNAAGSATANSVQTADVIAE